MDNDAIVSSEGLFAGPTVTQLKVNTVKRPTISVWELRETALIFKSSSKYLSLLKRKWKQLWIDHQDSSCHKTYLLSVWDAAIRSPLSS